MAADATLARTVNVSASSRDRGLSRVCEIPPGPPFPKGEAHVRPRSHRHRPSSKGGGSRCCADDAHPPLTKGGRGALPFTLPPSPYTLHPSPFAAATLTAPRSPGHSESLRTSPENT